MKKYFRDWGNFISFALALVPSILLFVFQPGNSVSYIVFVITVLLAFLFAWLTLKLYLDSKENSCKNYIELVNCVNGRCLCKPNPFLGHHSIVSFYNEIDGFEELITYGYVETITDKKLVQIILFPNDKSKEESFSYISNHRSSIVIKPTISIETAETIKILNYREDL